MRNRYTSVFLSALIASILLSGSSRAAELAGLSAALESITTGELKQHVDVLASDTFEGREAGSRGGRAAAAYLVRELARLKAMPAGEDGGYYQQFGRGYRNVLARIDGSDPELKRQVIVVGAHYDHVGYGARTNSRGPIGYIHNGADDNASGTAALLELIDALQHLPQPPRRTILFAFWDGEEKGLLGSEHWVRSPGVPLDDVVFAVNLDMVGRMRGGRMKVFGTRSAAGLRRLVSEQNEAAAAEIDFDWELKRNSDHWPFYERRIPVLVLHTGKHDDYHRPHDDAHKINHRGLRRVSHLLLHLLLSLADAEKAPAYRPQSRYEAPADRKKLEAAVNRRRPPRLGVWWDERDARPGLVVQRVMEGSAAERGGLQPGDRILALDGREATEPDAFRWRILTAAKQVSLQIERGQPAERKSLSLSLDGSPLRIGVSWRLDSAEPDTAVIVEVVPGSAADEAGLQVGDRIYGVGGRPLGNPLQLGEQLTTATLPLILMIERHGQLRSVKLHVQ